MPRLASASLHHASAFLAAITLITAPAALAQEKAPDTPEVKRPSWLVFTNGNPLSMIEKVLITGPKADADTVACEINVDVVHRAAARAILDGGLQVTDDAEAGPELMLRLIAGKTTDASCAVYVSAELYDFTAVLPTHQQITPLDMLMDGRSDAVVQVAPAIVRLSQAGILLAGRLVGLGDLVADQTRRLADDIVTKIKLANQPK